MAMRKSRGATRTCCSLSAPRPGRICSPARCLPSNCSARHRSLRTILIIAKDRDLRIAAPFLALPLLAAASAPMPPPVVPLDSQLQQARVEQAAAERAAARLEQAAAKAQGEADRL